MKSFPGLFRKALLIGIFFSIFTSFPMLSQNTYDISKPADGLAMAKQNLKNALEQNDYQAELDALLHIIVFQSEIDPDLTNNDVSKIDSLRLVTKDSAAAGLLAIIEAELLEQIYFSDQYKYNKTETPDFPFPEDISQWNGNQFKTRIKELIEFALDKTSAAASVPLKDYENIFSYNRNGEIVCPNIGAFIFLKANEISVQIDNDVLSSAIVSKALESAPEGSSQWAYWKIKHIVLDYQNIDPEGIAFYNFFTDKIIPLYEKYKKQPAGLIFLKEATEHIPTEISLKKRLLEILNQNIKLNPPPYYLAAFKNAAAELTQPEAQLQNLPSLVAVGKDIPFNLNVSNAKKVTVSAVHKNGQTKIELTAEFTEALPFDSVADLKINFPIPGEYEIGITINNKKEKRKSYSTVLATTFLALGVNNVSNPQVGAFDFMTGAPVKGVKVSSKAYNTKSAPKYVGATGSDGILSYKPLKTPSYFIFSRGAEKVDFSQDISVDNLILNSQKDLNYQGLILTDRKLYHPGDSVKGVVIAAYSSEGNPNLSSLDGKSIEVSLYNVNYTPVDTLEIKTDSFGRAQFEFKLPENTLSGNFKIKAKYKDFKLSSASIMVSDFKLPTFEVKVTEVLRDKPAKGDVTIKGKAMTFSGMPVASAEVSAEISTSPFRCWWYNTSVDEIGEISTLTDENGDFTLVAANSLLHEEDNDILDFVCDISVTSQAAETRETSTYFTIGKPYGIFQKKRGELKVNVDNPVNFNILVNDAQGDPVEIPLKYKIFKDKREVASGNLAKPSESVDISFLSGGNYTLLVEAADSDLCDPLKDIPLALYSIRNNSMPEDNLIFIPEGTYFADDSRRAVVTFGVSSDDTYVYIADASGYLIDKYSVDSYNKGFYTREISVKPDAGDTGLLIFSVKDGQFCKEYIFVKIKSDRNLKITASSFRDKVSAGDKETWTFKISDSKGNVPSSPAMTATMYNEALNSLLGKDSGSWDAGRFYFYDLHTRAYINACIPHNLSLYDCMPVKRVPLGEGIIMPEFNPELNLYHQALYKRAYSSDNKIYGARAVPEMAAIIENDMVLEESVPVYPENDGREKQNSSAPEIDYRPAETLQAFWMPAVNVLENGTAEISFTVPNAIGAWSFNAFAWDAAFSSSYFSKVVTASKKVMVNPNAPRFLRNGDKARVASTVYNNTDSVASVKVSGKLFNPLSNDILNEDTATLVIPANGSAIYYFDVQAPMDCDMLAFAVSASNGDFSDGEQDLIPVLEAYSPVIDSENFWLNPGDKGFVTTVPDGKNSQSVMEYTDNTAWDIIKILPALRNYKPCSAPSAAESLFEAYVSSGIIKKWPGVEKMIAAWLNNPSDSMMVSKLQQNDILKQISTEFTPWVPDADADTRRMTSLALLLDSKAIDKSISVSMAKLKKLQNADGGFRWGDWSKKSSLWATQFVLNSLCRLKVAGYYPSSKELESMVSRAALYVEKSLFKGNYDKYVPGFATGVSVLPGKPQTVEGQQVLQYTLQKFSADWKKMSPASKAQAAMALHLNGYKSTALEIINSLSQYTLPAGKGKGITMPRADIDQVSEILLAFGMIKPDDPIVNGLRQWLTVRMQLTLEAGAWDPTLLAAAFLRTGSNWLIPSQEPVLTIGDRPVTLPSSAAQFGTFNLSLGADMAGKNISLSRTSDDSPAYGWILTRSKKKITSVKASSCPELSVEKKISVIRDGKPVYTDEFHAGERVLVTLVIKAENDLQYVTVTDARPACMEPVDQLPGDVESGGIYFYRENNDTETNLFVDFLPKGVYTITTEMTLSSSGEFISGLAVAQSQLAPAVTARSSGSVLNVRP